MINISLLLKVIITLLWIIILQLSVIDNLLISDITYIPAYLVLLITVPRSVKIIPSMMINFIVGMIFDFTSGNHGSITSILVIMAVIRPFILNNLISTDLSNYNKTIKLNKIPFGRYLGYIISYILIFNVLLFLLEGIAYLPTLKIISKITMSTILTIPVILTLQLLIFDDYK